MDLEAISINYPLTSFTLYFTCVKKKNEIRNQPIRLQGYLYCLKIMLSKNGEKLALVLILENSY